ncbi:MAG: hypothetical protein IT372_30620 [Polyangiaceae bacterium]|nr:hypothetical protein [Polyangiaceae bacterium]
MRAACLALVLALFPACAGGGAAAPSGLRPELAAAEPRGALALSDALEALIEAGVDTADDRAAAYERVRAREEPTAAYAFARAAITGRLAQARGLTAGLLVGEVERWALRSRELDPGFRDGAAARMLGSLYALAPAALLEHGDSERGVELLEGLAAAHPEVPENHLRLGEALLALGDRDTAVPHLCRAAAARARLRRDEAALLARLLHDAGGPTCAAGP